MILISFARTITANLYAVGRKENNESKNRKIALEYVRLCGYEHGEVGRNHVQRCQNGISEKLTLDEIATQLGTSKRELQRALSIERNLTESMKQLLDDGVITKSIYDFMKKSVDNSLQQA